MENIHRILIPIYSYLALLTIFYALREMNMIYFSVSTSLGVIVFMPIILFGWSLQRIRKYSIQKKGLIVFGITAIPGLLLGLQLFYGFTGTLEGVFTWETGLVMLLIGLITGWIFGVIGLLINGILNQIAVSKRRE